jgi:hypothetical protein
MESLVPIIFLAGWIGTWYLGWKIKNWKHRWMAVILPVIFPYIGLIIALLLDKKCPHCRSYISMAADVCSKCGRTIKTGKVDIDVKAVAGADVKAPPASPKSEAKIVYDPETHQYVKVQK